MENNYEYYRNNNGTLYCGDCLDIMPHLPVVDMILTDPPYKTISGGTSSALANKWKTSVLAKNDGKIFEVNSITPKEYCQLFFKVLKEGKDAYVMTNNLTLLRLLTEADNAGFKFHGLLGWEKNTYTANRWYMKNLEYVCYFYKFPAKRIKDASSKQIFKADNITNKLHPTQKPVSLFSHYIENSTNIGDTVIDPFIGGGTTAVACERLNRKWIGIEQDEKYCAIAKKRIIAEEIKQFNPLI